MRAVLHGDRIKWIAVAALLCAAGCSSAGPLQPLNDAPGDGSRTITVMQAPERADLEQSVRAIEEAAAQPLAQRLSSEQLLQVLDYHCGECHFPAADGGNTDGLFFLDDLPRLIDAGKVIPGNGIGSRLVQRILSGEMPPAGAAAPPVPPAMTAQIAQYIDGLLPAPVAATAPTIPSVPPPADPMPVPASRPPQMEPPRPNVPPVTAPCFTYLGDWIRCEHEGLDALRVDLPDQSLEVCLQACRERADCVAVTDYTWLGLPALGCYLYLSSCAAPASGPWHEEDGGRQYLKSCR